MVFNKNCRLLLIAMALCAQQLSGCSLTELGKQDIQFSQDPTPSTIQLASAEFPVEPFPVEPSASFTEEQFFTASNSPFSLNSGTPPAYWDLSLQETIQQALANSTVLRDLGGRILQAPAATATSHSPSITKTDPQFGVEAALSEFDALFSSRVFYEKNNRSLNNSLLGGGTNFFEQDLWRVQSELRKQTASGTRFALRHNVEDDLNNAPQNIFGTNSQLGGHAWSWNLEAEVRQPLLQGNGTAFNRIAGPNATPGIINGVMIARVNTDISAIDFQLALRGYLSNVENAYWDLVFAYRDLDIKKKSRDRSLKTWQELKQRNKEGIENAALEKVAYAEEQYHRFNQEVEEALTGRLVDGTREFNGSTGGTFQGAGGVYVAERRLRNIVGLPINDGRLIRPSTEPSQAQMAFDWDEVMATALAQRPEFSRQQLVLKRREMELIANRNFLSPRLDAVALYRYRGLGNSLYHSNLPRTADPLDGSINGDTSEWQLGLELQLPLGLRQAHSAVRNSQLEVARERALLYDIERQITHDMSNAIGNSERAHRAIQSNWNRRILAEKQIDLLSDSEAQEEIDYTRLIDAERRSADAASAYHRSLVDYTVALKNVYLEMGNLMQYCNVEFAQ